MAVSMLVQVPGDSRHVVSNPRHDNQLKIKMLDLLVHLVQDNNRPCAGISKLMGELVFGVCRIAGDDDAPGPQNAEVRNDGLRGIWKTEGDAVSLADSQGGKTACESLNQIVAFAVRHSLPEEIERRSP
jgi:hypothetical protein